MIESLRLYFNQSLLSNKSPLNLGNYTNDYPMGQLDAGNAGLLGSFSQLHSARVKVKRQA